MIPSEYQIKAVQEGCDIPYEKLMEIFEQSKDFYEVMGLVQAFAAEQPPQTGVYQHFKGGLYVVEAEALHTETEEKLVIYRNGKGQWFARPTSMFFEEVEKDGYKGPRFKFLKEVLIGAATPEFLLNGSK